MLLTKAELNLAKLASKEESRYALQGIAVQPTETVVTNGHYLVTVKHIGLSEENYPLTAGLEHKKLQNGPVSETVLVSTEAALGAVKALAKKTNIPVLATAALGTDQSLYVNNLDSVQSFKHKMEGKFPTWQTIVPTKKPKAEIVLDADYLALLAKFVSDNREGDLPLVRLTVYDDNTAIRFDSPKGNQPIMALLMPVRYNPKDFPQRPHEVKKEKPATAEPVPPIADNPEKAGVIR